MSNFIDITGRVFGRLIVLERDKARAKRTRWMCRCDCGVVKSIEGTHLKLGQTRSCGCLRTEMSRERASMNILGQKFGRLEVVGKTKENRNGYTYWICKCECGNEKIINGSNLVSGNTQSCGCLWHETVTIEYGQSSFNQVYWAYKKRSQYRNQGFDLAKDEFRELTQRNCFYCNVKPSSVFEKKNGSYTYNGLDRIDNDKGYIRGNVVTCCEHCNTIRGYKKQADFIDWVERISKNLKAKGLIE